MPRTVIATLALTLLAAPALADDTGRAGSAIERVIGNQIAAMRQDDFASAFSYASPGIQGMFQTSDNFGAMVRNGYPMVWHPAAVKYLGVHDADGRPTERVMVVDPGGRAWLLDYHMIEAGGSWRIDGVEILPPQGAGA